VTPFVLDASVAAKWFLPAKYERLTEEALALLGKYVQGEVKFIVPDIFWAELGSAFWKAIRLGRFDKSSALEALRYLKNCDLPVYTAVTLLDTAFAIAITFDRSVYDSLYVALAVHSRAPLITADERLVSSLASHFPVRWLGGL
jgi:predicted nucleic acid-binding protein